MQPKSKKGSKKRPSRGASIFILVLLLVQLLLVIDFCAFNLVRMMTVQREINTVCEASALAGTSRLSKIDVLKTDSAGKKPFIKNQKLACAEAEHMLLREHILNARLSGARRVASLAELTDGIHPEETRYFISLAEPSESHQIVEFGNPAGTTVSCSVAYGYRPSFLANLVNICYPIIGNCIGGLPQIDSVLVLDVSCSMDDETAVTFVRREWIHNMLGRGEYAMGNTTLPNMNPGIIQYVSLDCPITPHTILNYLAWDFDEKKSAVGSMINALPPQNLDKGANQNFVRHPMYFDAYLRAHYPCFDSKINYQPSEISLTPYLRSLDYATPPGNCDLGASVGGNGDSVTDLQGNYKPMQARPPLNAFVDMTWQYDGQTRLNFEPAAPGANNARAENDPLPSPDQQTFTDLVVNITKPTISASTGLIDQPLTGPDTFVGFQYTFPVDEPDSLLRNQTFSFTNIAVLVEAARGNLEASSSMGNSLTNGQRALIDRPVSVDGEIFNMNSIEPRDGYQRAYQRLAMLCIQPLATVLQALDNSYFQRLHRLADCRFGLVCFSSSAAIRGRGYSDHARTYGTSDNYSYYVFNSPYNRADLANAVYDSAYLPLIGRNGLNSQPVEDGFGWGFRVPRIELDSRNDHYLDCLSKNFLKDGTLNNRLNAGNRANGIYNCRAQSDKDFAECLDTAKAMFSSSMYNIASCSKERTPARRIITFITSGEVEGGAYGALASEALRIAGEGTTRTSHTCASEGIAIFTLGLNLAKGKAFAEEQQFQRLFLDDNAPFPGEPGGLSWRAGHGGRYYSCTDLSQIESNLSDISSRFSQLK